MNWLTVMTREEAIAKGMAVPPTWRLVTIGLGKHGVAKRWPFGTIGEHPIHFVLCAATIVLLVYFVLRITKYADHLKNG